MFLFSVLSLSFRVVFVGEQYAGGLVDADAEIPALGASALMGIADRHADVLVLPLVDVLAVAAMAACSPLHDGAHTLVGVVSWVE